METYYNYNKCGFWKELLKMLFGCHISNKSKQFDETVRAEELKRKQLQNYRDFLVDLAEKSSPEMFSNGGKDYASILMSVLLQNTNKEARIYSKGFRSDLITTDPYWSELQTWLSNPNHKLMVMVDTDEHINEKPLQLLLKVKTERDRNGYPNTILVRRISKNSKDLISKKYGQECNFAIFDENKFRYEYEPVSFKAYGSFNQPETCMRLKEVFDLAFNDAIPMFV